MKCISTIYCLIKITTIIVITFCFQNNVNAQGCDFLEGEAIYYNIAGYNMESSFTQTYALTETNGTILEIVSMPMFSAQNEGTYFIYGLNFETNSGITGFSLGNNINAITGSCFDTTRATINVCVCDTDCHSTDGTVILNISNYNNDPDFTQSYALADNTGSIIAINNNPSNLNPLFTGVATGNYRVYALNYETTLGTTNYAIGNNIRNVTGSCLDMEGPFCYNICEDIIPNNYTGCNSDDGTVRINGVGFNRTAEFTQSYALADTNGIIQRIHSTPLFLAVPAGKYQVYALNYETAAGLTNYTIGNAINTVSGSCLDISDPTYYQVCRCPFTSCNSEDGTISITNTNYNANSDFTQTYALTDTLGTIIQTIDAPQSTNPLFSNLDAGYYHLYALNYEIVSGITGLSTGNNMANVSGTCMDVEGAFCYQICQDTTNQYTGCNSDDGTIRVNSVGFNRTAGFTQSYALADTNGIIQRIHPTPLFLAVPAGKYQVYALNYETATSIANYTVGNTINTVYGSCLDISDPIYYQVCRCPFTDCNSDDGTIFITNTDYNGNSDFTQTYALTDTLGTIIQMIDAPQSTNPLFSNIATGYYHLYALNYDTISGITGLSTGNNMANVSGICLDVEGAFCFQVCNDNYDWGDLPDISDSTAINDYQTLLTNNGPRHLITSGLSLGDTVDIELDGQPNNKALGDGIDEDGLIIFPSMDLAPGTNFRLPFSYINTTQDTAHVEAWIDWNGDGDFNDANEMVVNLDDANTLIPNRLELSVPINAVTGIEIGLRIRISLQDNMTPYGVQPNGEIEDYLLTIGCPKICLPISASIKK